MATSVHVHTQLLRCMHLYYKNMCIKVQMVQANKCIHMRALYICASKFT